MRLLTGVREKVLLCVCTWIVRGCSVEEVLRKDPLKKQGPLSFPIYLGLGKKIF